MEGAESIDFGGRGVGASYQALKMFPADLTPSLAFRLYDDLVIIVSKTRDTTLPRLASFVDHD